MLNYIGRRLLLAVPLMLVASILVFALLKATTDPTAILRNPRMTAEQLERVKHATGLDRSGPAQYLSWISNFVRGDWGVSIQKQRDVFEMVRERLANTIKLMVGAILLSGLLALAIGVYSAIRPYSVSDFTFTGLSFLGISIPPFWFGLMAQLVLGFYLMQWLGAEEPLFYTTGIHSPGDASFRLLDYARHAALPTLTLSIQLIASWGRYERGSMLEVMGADYMRTARAKGLSELRVVLRHGLRNALIPFVTVVALDVGLLFGGLIITEQIFSWPGMGSLLLGALSVGDYPVVLAALMVTAGFVVLFNLIADVLYGVLDPRIRYD